MTIRSARRDSQTKVREKLGRQRKLAISGALFGSAIPFMAAPLAIAMGVLAAYAAVGIEQKLAVNEKPVVWDSLLEESDLTDCDLRRNTYLGQAMPYSEWKAHTEDVRNEKGYVSANSIRETLNEVYPQMMPFMLTDDLMTRHVALLAATGTGKTELLLGIIQQQIRKGAGLILVEAKSDSDFAGSIYAMMDAADRLDQFKLINFEFPEQSHTYNPFYSGGVRSTISTAMKVQANSTEEFWTDIARFTLTAAVLTLKLQPGAPAFNIKDMIALLMDFELLLSYIEKIRPEESKYHKEGEEWLYSYMRNWWKETDKEWNYNSYKTLTQGLVSKLSAFAHSEYSSIVNTYAPDVDLKHAILNNEVVVLSMSSLADPQGARLFGQLFISDLARAVGEIQLEKSKPLSMCPAIFDEYPSFMDATHVQLFQLARSANVPIIIAFQGVGFLEDISPAFVEMVLGNCWHHLYCDIRDAKTREFAVKLAGSVVTQMESSAEGRSIGASHAAAESGLVANQSDGESATVSTKSQREELIQLEDFSTLDQGDGIMVGKSGTYRIRMPLVRNTFPNVQFADMQLVRRRPRGRPGVYAWDEFTRRNKSTVGR
ncbi:TraM recognition domain-containing protein [Pseudomonas syringae]|uniref:type IV secretory system conjugative DNA transfer family protein n=1 Tax=Pseudomonas syringae TaxID=317 RepID=UPI001F224FE1|nr:TraM recognition domain-containing protein [Pseudomonas syringae]MCF5381932.1 TraM recognition domain-containing protein [Pseudomonas syringae]MCF5423814.1 TraM recognition domain-containing protein [Pseudomonas syringae]MCF5455005.1 TraM recognition domain-containing protein [Pseudomonas syringae]MCF5459557.1 TraM recognition domain-containing protein [Pseudomonas syringae]